MTSLRVLAYSEQNAGKTLKFTKKLYSWELLLEEKPVNVQFLRSKVSSKKKVMVNGEVRFKGRYSGSTFQCLFHIGEHTLVVIQQGKSYDLRVDSLSFAHLWLRQKTEREFIFEETAPAADSKPTTRLEENKERVPKGFTINPKTADHSAPSRLALIVPPPRASAPQDSSPKPQAPVVRPVPAPSQPSLLDDLWTGEATPGESASGRLLS